MTTTTTTIAGMAATTTAAGIYYGVEVLVLLRLRDATVACSTARDRQVGIRRATNSYRFMHMGASTAIGKFRPFNECNPCKFLATSPSMGTTSRCPQFSLLFWHSCWPTSISFLRLESSSTVEQPTTSTTELVVIPHCVLWRGSKRFPTNETPFSPICSPY